MKNDNVAFATQSKCANQLQRRSPRRTPDKWFGARRGEHRYNTQPVLGAAPEKQSIQQQQDHRANDRHNPAGHVILAHKNATDPRANKRTGDAKQNRDDATAGSFPGINSFAIAPMTRPTRMIQMIE
jgi:hypothetical protein